MIRVRITASWCLPVYERVPQALEQDSVMDVIKKRKDVFEPARPSMRKVDITITAGGETNHRVVREAASSLALPRSFSGDRLVLKLF